MGQWGYKSLLERRAMDSLEPDESAPRHTGKGGEVRVVDLWQVYHSWLCVVPRAPGLPVPLGGTVSSAYGQSWTPTVHLTIFNSLMVQTCYVPCRNHPLTFEPHLLQALGCSPTVQSSA